jgi:hypothetical protein
LIDHGHHFFFSAETAVTAASSIEISPSTPTQVKKKEIYEVSNFIAPKGSNQNTNVYHTGTSLANYRYRYGIFTIETFEMN